MRLIKKINNNFALALDANGEEIIVEGKGIGFEKMPCDLKDLSIISRSYYGIDEHYIGLLNDIPFEVIDIANKVVEYASSKIDNPISSNLAFILADHINFSIERYESNIKVKMPLQYDIQHLYPVEYEIAGYALKLIKETLKIYLPDTEKAGIAMNIINAELMVKSEGVNDFDEWTDQFTNIIETCMNVRISKNSYNYSRFVSHIQYLFNRVKDSKSISSDNLKMYLSLKNEFPETTICVEKMGEYLEEQENIALDEEEKLYLILHINRLCNREDCNRKGITPNR